MTSEPSEEATEYTGQFLSEEQPLEKITTVKELRIHLENHCSGKGTKSSSLKTCTTSSCIRDTHHPMKKIRFNCRCSSTCYKVYSSYHCDLGESFELREKDQGHGEGGGGVYIEFDPVVINERESVTPYLREIICGLAIELIDQGPHATRNFMQIIPSFGDVAPLFRVCHST